MALKMKEGVSPKNIKNECLLGMHLSSWVFDHHGYDCIITSISEGKHSKNSRHYIGYAFDLRRRHLPYGLAETIEDDLQAELGEEYKVILEDTHFHIQYNG